MSDSELFPIGSVVVYGGTLREAHGTYIVVSAPLRRGEETRTLRPCAVCIGPDGTPSPFLTGGRELTCVRPRHLRSALPA